MRQALERLSGRIAPGGIALLFSDGFGIQTTTRQTYLLPVDAQSGRKRTSRMTGSIWRPSSTR
jgi:hypothetical protein